MRTPVRHARHHAGFSLVEVMIALIVLSLGVLAVARLFPIGARTQAQDHIVTKANDYAQEKIEQLAGKTWSDTTLTVGRHPSGTSTESLGNGNWRRYYTVTAMNSPLDNLKRIDVTVTYSGAGRNASHDIVATTYVRR